jgi:hypothetical protein
LIQPHHSSKNNKYSLLQHNRIQVLTTRHASKSSLFLYFSYNTRWHRRDVSKHPYVVFNPNFPKGGHTGAKISFSSVSMDEVNPPILNVVEVVLCNRFHRVNPELRHERVSNPRGVSIFEEEMCCGFRLA